MAAPNPAAMMNTMIGRAATRQRDVGLIDRLKTSAPLENERAKRFRELVNRHEAAVRRGSVEEASALDHALDALFDESRAAREAEPDLSNVGQPAPEPQPVSFDGGARRGRAVKPQPKPMGFLDLARRELAARDAVAQRAREQADLARDVSQRGR